MFENHGRGYFVLSVAFGLREVVTTKVDINGSGRMERTVRARLSIPETLRIVQCKRHCHFKTALEAQIPTASGTSAGATVNPESVSFLKFH